MRWTPLVIATTMLALPLPLAVAEEAACAPRSEDFEAELALDAENLYYARKAEYGTAQYFELWKESNGEPGLQTKAGTSCGGKADTLVESFCASRFCALTL